MIEIPYGTPGYIPVPLITSSTEEFKDNPTLAAGDAKLWTDGQILANVASYSAPFTSGKTRAVPGDEIYNASASSQTAVVVAMIHTSGSFASTNAGGILYARALTTGFSSAASVGITGGTSAAFAISTSLAAGVVREIDRGHVAIPYTSSEMLCKTGFFLMEDSTAAKEWQDQSVPFITIGHPSAGNPFKAIPMPMAILSSASTGSVLEVSSGVPTTGAWNGGVLMVVKDGLEAFGHAGRTVVASSSGGDLTLDPAFVPAPTTGWGVYLAPAPKGPSSSGSYLPHVNTLRIAGARVTGIGTSSDAWDGSTDVV